MGELGMGVDAITLITSCQNGKVMKTMYDGYVCQTKQEFVHCDEHPFFALWAMGDADLTQANCTGVGDCPSSVGQCDVWSVPTNGTYDGETIVGPVQVYFKSGTAEVDAFDLPGASLEIHSWDTSSPISPEMFDIPEEWNCKSDQEMHVFSGAVCPIGAQFPLPPKHVIAASGTTRRWYDDAQGKARVEFGTGADAITLITSCQNGKVMKTMYDGYACQTKQESVHCDEHPFFPIWALGDADLTRVNCSGVVDCPSSHGQCEVWSMPTRGTIDGELIVGPLQVYIKSGTDEVDTLALVHEAVSVVMDNWDTTSPINSGEFDIPEEWNCS